MLIVKYRTQMKTNVACGFENVNLRRARKSEFLSARMCFDYQKVSVVDLALGTRQEMHV